ncbi:MAG: rhomboid family intramembrane serine protease [Bacteroidota bacterium]|nr:rhomboid family intramembrane serine protease [Bacteroidota bacterium]
MSNLFNDVQNTFSKGRIFTKLIIVNIVAFVIYWIIMMTSPVAADFFTVPGNFKTLLYQPWTIVTYMFLHANFLHLLFNMLWLFWFGQIFLQYLHDKQLLAVYLMGGLFGALSHLAVNQLLSPDLQAGIVGSSAAVMAVVFAISLYKPDYKINLLFIGAVKIKYVAYVALALDIMGSLQNLKTDSFSGDGVAHIAHMGGALYGIWFAFQLKNGKDITRGINNFLDSIVTWFRNTFSENKPKPGNKNYNRFSKPKTDREYNKEKSDKQKEVDRILDKISHSGYNSLTKKEKEFLFKFKQD